MYAKYYISGMLLPMQSVAVFDHSGKSTLDSSAFPASDSRQAKQRNTVGCKNPILPLVTQGLSRACFMESVTIGLDGEHGAFAHAVIDQKVDMCSRMQRINPIFLGKQGYVMQKLLQRLMTDDTEMAECGCFLYNPFQ